MLKKDIQRALELVRPGLANTEFIVQSTSFAFMGDRVTTFNDDISISHPIVGLELTGAVKAEEFYQLLSKIPQEEIEIELKENEIIISAGKAKAGLILQDKISLPLDEVGAIGDWKPLPEKFIDAIQFILPAAFTDMSKPSLTCLHIRKDGICEASDNLRITQFTIDEMPINSFLIPAKIAKELIKYPVKEIAEGSGWKHFRTGEGTIFSCRIFEEIYPDIDEMGIMNVVGQEIVFPKGFSDILGRAAIFSKEEYTLDKEVSITIADKKIEVKSKSDFGWFEESMNIRYTGAPISILIHPIFLSEMLSKIQACIISDKAMKFIGGEWAHVVWLKEIE